MAETILQFQRTGASIKFTVGTSSKVALTVAPGGTVEIVNTDATNFATYLFTGSGATAGLSASATTSRAIPPLQTQYEYLPQGASFVDATSGAGTPVLFFTPGIGGP